MSNEVSVMAKEQIHILVSKELKEIVKEVAKENNMNVSTFISTLLLTHPVISKRVRQSITDGGSFEVGE